MESDNGVNSDADSWPDTLGSGLDLFSPLNAVYCRETATRADLEDTSLTDDDGLAWGQHVDISSPPVFWYASAPGIMPSAKRRLPRFRVNPRASRSSSEASEESIISEDDDSVLFVRGVHFTHAAAIRFLVSTHPTASMALEGPIAVKLRRQFTAAPRATRTAVLANAVAKAEREFGADVLLELVRKALKPS